MLITKVNKENKLRFVLLVGRLICGLPFLEQGFVGANGTEGTGTRASQGMFALPTALTAQRAFTAPDKGSGLAVPAASHGLQIVNDGLGRLWLLTIEGAADENALDRFGHVEPGTAQRGIERQDPLLDQPAHHFCRTMPGQVIPDQQHPQGGQVFRQGQRLGQPGLPQLPQCAVHFRVQGERLREAGKNPGQFLLQPGMEHSIGAAGDPLEVDGPAGRVEERQQFGGAVAHVFMRLLRGLSLRLPALAGIRHGLKRPRLVFGVHRQSQLFAHLIGLFD